MKAQKIPAHDRDAAQRWLQEHITPGVFVLQMCHDDGCKALATHRDADCKAPCVPDFYLVPLPKVRRG